MLRCELQPREAVRFEFGSVRDPRDRRERLRLRTGCDMSVAQSWELEWALVAMVRRIRRGRSVVGIFPITIGGVVRASEIMFRVAVIRVIGGIVRGVHVSARAHESAFSVVLVRRREVRGLEEMRDQCQQRDPTAAGDESLAVAGGRIVAERIHGQRTVALGRILGSTVVGQLSFGPPGFGRPCESALWRA